MVGIAEGAGEDSVSIWAAPDTLISRTSWRDGSGPLVELSAPPGSVGGGTPILGATAGCETASTRGAGDSTVRASGSAGAKVLDGGISRDARDAAISAGAGAIGNGAVAGGGADNRSGDRIRLAATPGAANCGAGGDSGSAPAGFAAAGTLLA
ncbi:MAG TPA: hypothetical protein VNX86_03185 [Rhizomicrobium sp.]|nr:hypothetical protein [Rhizomicrobium sp.]